MNRLFPLALVALLFTGCSCGTGYNVETRTEDPAPPTKEKPNEEKPKGQGHAALHIPPGHLPDPGECRIWIPGTPPGQQSPAGDCAELAEQIPPGAYLISRATKKSKEFDVAVYDETTSGVVLEIRIYSTKNGKFIGLR